MLTIWSRIIRDLANSNDETSHKLAEALIDDKKDFYRMWACQDRAPYWYRQYSLDYNSVIRQYIHRCVYYDATATVLCYKHLIAKYNLLNS